MGTKKLFTPEEVEILKANPYTWKVSADRITYTQDFQKAFWELSLQDLSRTDAFKALGYDPKILGVERIHNTTKRIRKQGNSPEGIRKKPTKWMRTSRKQFKAADLEKMSQRGCCWDNAPQESFYGHMKDELAEEIPYWETFADVKQAIDDWMDYYYNDRYQWDLAKLSPNEYYQYITTGAYPDTMVHEQDGSN